MQNPEKLLQSKILLVHHCWQFFYKKLSFDNTYDQIFPKRLSVDRAIKDDGQTIINYGTEAYERGDIRIRELALLELDTSQIHYIIIHEVAHAASYLTPLPDKKRIADGPSSWMGCDCKLRAAVREQIAQYMTHDYLTTEATGNMQNVLEFFLDDCNNRDEDDPYKSWRNINLDYFKINDIRGDFQFRAR